MTQGLDYAGGRPGGAAIARAGYSFVSRYLTDGGPGLPGKLLTPEEADDLRAHGIDIVANYETYADRMLVGYDAGCYDAEAGLTQARACGMPDGRPIYFSADWDATPAQQAAINGYLTGAGTVIGEQNVGIYGGYYPVSRALDAGVAHWAWQTDAWSGGQVDPRINMHQRIGTAWVGGVSCDVNEADTPDFGQWSLGGDMQLSDTITDAYGNSVSVGDALKWLLYHTDLTVDQIGGAGTRNDMPAQFGGWPQLNNRTVVDALAEIGAHLGIPGYTAPTAPATPGSAS
ncbi:DUF1906 domain-containing protein [Nocardia vaccinii]|uniref:DUF1906 domain-containing protein n=1 Tax=Nocardia vaccinii TaxID=1822 RepID=UPI0008331437|nr:DUF1906 domain-containing protein [Nocardia vaccinii]